MTGALRLAVALTCGLLFGSGLALSGMLDPARVRGFLDVGGPWDPSLAFVLGGAVSVSSLGYALARRLSEPAPGSGTCARTSPGSAKPPINRARASAASSVDPRVVDDLPRPVPVGRAELDVLEMYLGPALDAILRAMKP